MKIKVLLDENMEPGYKSALQHLFPEIDVLTVGDSDAPPKQTPDVEILRYVAHAQRVLVTKNRRSIVEHHLPEYLEQGGQSWGIFWVRQDTSYRGLAEELYLIWENSSAEDWMGRFLTLPYFT